MIYLLTYQVLIFTFYIIYIWRNYGVQPSISDSWYIMKEKWLFTFFIWSLAIVTCFYGTLLFFLSGAFLAFVGAATAFKDKMTDKVHYIGATGGISLSLIALAELGIWLPLISTISISVILILFKTKNKTWWIEVQAFVNICIGIFVNNLKNL